MRRLRWWVGILHVLVVVSVFLSHIHYTIDVVAGYAAAYILFTLREGKPTAGMHTNDLGPRWGDAK